MIADRIEFVYFKPEEPSLRVKFVEQFIHTQTYIYTQIYTHTYISIKCSAVVFLFSQGKLVQ